MFNLLISSNPEAWEHGIYEYDRSRVAIEYTATEISERYKFLEQGVVEELKSFPTLFVTENEQTESKIGYIKSIRLRSKTVVIEFEIDPILPSLPIGAINQMAVDIDLGSWELSRTHWAIKDEPLFDILVRHGYLNPQQVDAATNLKLASTPEPQIIETKHGEFNNEQVFIVHGHDEIAKMEVADFITSLGLQPIILHMQASSGRTIIEKIEHYSNVGFGIVLYTPCDFGSKVGALNGTYRARQNVVFEHGYLIGKLSRSRVAAVVKGQVETPNDISGVVYVSMNQDGSWKTELTQEMRSVGYEV
ncbi:TIR domain-containing protein [Vibrio tubiashii]|uniref:DNA-binding protein n=1 Tax=Vibrio tubiashii ATCC 19109 TaxID=1051646 RepID=F9T3V9_9VIBR|nr:nucleotide-binding protein [Vibrio tubiashii]AIW17172.1 DNA-binding protein [Vibrio tubiashii ATCC 19109]EGU56474.1 nucleotide-binding protein [Vibrio tubiashii ATCC 19109]EIF01327.1 nucleotide-binding protein [Vibrio tubiashii NCIMB 1337 = ATCC 19106]